MTTIETKNRLKRSLLNFISAYDSYTVGLLIAGVVMITLELIGAA